MGDNSKKSLYNIVCTNVMHTETKENLMVIQEVKAPFNSFCVPLDFDLVNFTSKYTDSVDNSENLRLKEDFFVKHFKRDETKDAGTSNYIYKILNMSVIDVKTDELMVLYQAQYPPYNTYCRPQGMFLSEVDHDKYPDVKQVYRLERYNG